MCCLLIVTNRKSYNSGDICSYYPQYFDYHRFTSSSYHKIGIYKSMMLEAHQKDRTVRNRCLLNIITAR